MVVSMVGWLFSPFSGVTPMFCSADDFIIEENKLSQPQLCSVRKALSYQ